MHSHASCGHDAHSHLHGAERRLSAAVVLNLVITIAQLIGGVISGSLALISDALHNLSDTVSLATSWGAMKIAKRKSTERKSFGYRRVEILAAFVNLLGLFAVCGYIVYEAILRLVNPSPVHTTIMGAVAFVGFAANLFSVILLMRHSAGSLNIRSAVLHLVGDMLASVGVMAGAAVIFFFPDFTWIDPLLSILIAGYIMKEAAGMLGRTVNVLMQGAPEGADRDAIIAAVSAHTGVADVHHVHLWSMDGTDIIMEAHIIASCERLEDSDRLIRELNAMLHERFGIHHATLQIESDRSCGDCAL
jgi:cobalt-zinc-cadmium efflux system protein